MLFMIGTMIAIITIISQQTVTVICDTARSLFKKLHCGVRVVTPHRLGTMCHPIANPPCGGDKTYCSTVFTTTISPHVGIPNKSNSNMNHQSYINDMLYIVPRVNRTYKDIKYDKHYECLSSIASSFHGVDGINFIRTVITPNMTNDTIMMVVDLLAHLNRNVDRTEHNHKRARFTRAQRHTMWHNRLKSINIPCRGAKRFMTNYTLQADEVDDSSDFQFTQTLAEKMAEKRKVALESIKAVEAALAGEPTVLPNDITPTPLLRATLMDQVDEQKRAADAMLASVKKLNRRYDDVTNITPNLFGNDVVHDYGDLILPVAILVYNIYRSRNVTDALVAVVSFAERLSSRNGHARVRAAATWATSYISYKNDELMGHLSALCKHFRSQPKVELQSSDYIGAFSAIASGITKSTHVRAFVYLTAFAFMGVTASISGVAPDINAFSKQALEMSTKIDLARSTTGVTIGLLTQSVQLCAELCSSFMRDGFQAFWSSDAKTMRKMQDDGKAILLRASRFAVCWQHKDMVQLGEDLKAYIDDYNAKKPKFEVYRIGPKFVGISFDSETNLASMWADVRKIAEGVIAAYEDYKAVLASVSFRVAPLCIGLVAGSSIGKTSVTQYIAKWFLMYEGMSDDMKYVYTVNPNQKFLDGYYPWQSVFVLDDVATVRPEYMKEGDPQVLGVIQWVNNVALLTNQADLNRKSNTPFLSRYVILTTNRKDLNAHKYANNYPAILRRVKWFVTVDVDDNFITSTNTLDTTKCAQWYDDGGTGIPPFWRYTIELCEVHNNGENMRNTYTTILERCDYDQLQDWLKKTTDEHWRIQNVIMQNVSTASVMKMCPECKKVSGSTHGNECSKRGAIVQASISEDIGDVGRIVVSSTGVAMLGAGCVRIVHALCTRTWDKLCAVYNWCKWCHYCITIGVAFVADLGYTVALMRETICSVNPIVRGAIAMCSWLSNLLVFMYIPWTYALVISAMFSQLPSRSVVAGRIGLKHWLKPMIGVGVGLTTVSALWYLGTRNGKNKVKGFEQADEPDFSAFEPNPTWGQGRRKPYEGESLVTAWPTNSRCTAGSSHEGVMDKIRRNQFVILVKSDGGATRGNGFVYEPGYIVINAHTLNKHRNRELMVTLAYMPQDRDLGDYGDEKPRNYTIGKVDACQVFYMPDSDLAMIHMPMETRTGLKGFVLDPGSANFGMDPHVMGRELNGAPFCVSVAYKHTAENVLYGEAPNDFYVKKCVHYSSIKEMKAGHSGSIYLVHSGRKAINEFGYMAIAGIHMGCANAVDGITGFVTIFDSKMLSNMREKLSAMAISHTMAISSNMGQLGPAFVKSANLHADVCVEDSIFDLEKGSVGGYLGPTHPKSAISWLDYNPSDGMVSLTVYGGISGDSRKSQGVASAYRPTPWSTSMCGHQRHLVLGDTSNQYLPAKVNLSELWQVHRICLLDLCGGDVRGPDTKALETAIAGYVSDVVQRVEMSGNTKSWSIIQPLTYHEVINGRDGIYDGIVKKTGGGFGYSGPKHKHVKMCDEPIVGLKKTGAHWTFDDDVMESVEAADRLLRRGIDPRFVYTCHLKDEVRSATKIEQKKVRMICGASIPCIILMRKYLLSLILFMQQNPVATECAVGLNVESKQWTDLGNYLRTKGGDDRYIAGDYKSFDKNQTFPISYAASRVMLLLVEHANILHGKYSAEDITAVRTILLGLCHPTYDFFGTLVRVLGTNPSGNTLTTQRNCIVNSLYMRCAFVVAANIYTGADFKVAIQWYSKAVSQINYGDDIVAAVAKGFSWFNHDVIAHVMGGWGITFTHADKSTDVGRPYDSFSDITFVKRSWVYDAEIQGYMAPLDPTSIVKSLHYYHQGNVLSTVQQQVHLIRDAAENALNYGRNDYENVCSYLRELAGCAGFSDSDYREATNFTSFDDYLSRYAINSVGNHKFVGIPCDMDPPSLLINIRGDYTKLLPKSAKDREGSFNPYGNGQPLVTDVSHYPLNVDQCKVITDSACMLSGLPTWICRPAWSYLLARWLNVQGADALALVENVAFVIIIILARLLVCAITPLMLCVCCCNTARRRYGLWLLFVAYVSGDVHWLWLLGSLIAIPLYREYLCGSFNPYGNGQGDWPAALHSNTIFGDEMLPLLDAVYEGKPPPVVVDLCETPFSHVYYNIGNRRFAHVDMSSFTVRESMVKQFMAHGGVLIKCDRGVHDDKWAGKALSFPGLAATTPLMIGNWTVRRRSAMVSGEGPRARATRFECTRGSQEIHIIYFTIDTPRVVKKRRVNISCPIYEPSGFVVDGTVTPP